MPPARWLDDSPTRYKSRVGLVEHSGEPPWSPDWNEIKAKVGTGASPNIPVIEVKSANGEAFLKGLFVAKSSGIEAAVKAQLARRGQFLDSTDRRLRRVADVVYRPGQSKFRDSLYVAYKGMESDAVQNGILLRVDLHRLFDRFLITVGADLRVHLDPRLRGGAYARFHGKPIRMPGDPTDAPDPQALATHWKACDYMTSKGEERT